MDLETILNKPIEELDETEKEYLKEHKGELTGGQCEEYKEILGKEKEPETPVSPVPPVSTGIAGITEKKGGEVGGETGGNDGGGGNEN